MERITIDTMTDRQAEVLRYARVELQKMPWYAGVVLDQFPCHERCKRMFFEAVADVVRNTTERDGPKKEY